MVGLGSFIIDPLCATSVVGIVLCIIGLVQDHRMRRAGIPVAGRGWIIAGLVLGCLSALLYGAILVNGYVHITNPPSPAVPLGPATNA